MAFAFRDIAGARVSARIPVSRELLNRLVADALEGRGTPVRSVDVRPRAGDRFDLFVTLSWPFVPPLKAVFVIEQQPTFPAAPVLALRWSFLGAAGTLASRLFDRLPDGMRLDHDRLLLDIPILAARSPLAALLPHVRTLELHTAEERAIVEVEWEVADVLLSR